MAKKATKPTKAKPKTTPSKADPGAAAEKPAESSPKQGRPPGSPNVDRVTVQRHPATCPRCGSTQRRVVRKAKEQARGGILAHGPNAGKVYTHTVWRDTVCECGQSLREMSHENRGAETDSEPGGAD